MLLMICVYKLIESACKYCKQVGPETEGCGRAGGNYSCMWHGGVKINLRIHSTVE